MAKVEIEISDGEEKEGMDSESEDSGFEDWEVDSACEAICRAEEIKKNKELWPLVQKKLEEKQANMATAIKSLSQLRKVAQEKSKE